MKRIIGICGPIAAGKDTAATYLSQKLNVSVYEISGILKQLAQARNIPLTRPDLTRFGTQLAREKGDGYLAQLILDQVADIGIVTGIRQLGQIDFFRKNADFFLIGIDAEPTVRFERASQRKKLGEAETLAEFIRQEQAENSAPNVQRLFECMQLADHCLTNNADPDSFYHQLDHLLPNLPAESL